MRNHSKITKEQIILNMCYTFDHAFGLHSEEKQNGIFLTMKQIYEHEIEPHHILKEDT